MRLELLDVGAILLLSLMGTVSILVFILAVTIMYEVWLCPPEERKMVSGMEILLIRFVPLSLRKHYIVEKPWENSQFHLDIGDRIEDVYRGMEGQYLGMTRSGANLVFQGTEADAHGFVKADNEYKWIQKVES